MTKHSIHPVHDDSADAAARLRERVKELRCLYQLSEALLVEGDLAHQLEAVVRILPPAWQHPDLAEARIRVRGLALETDGFSLASVRQGADIVIDGQTAGRVEVGYRDDSRLGDQPFLDEEEQLIREVGHKLARHVAHLEAEQRRQQLEQHLHHADRLATIGRLAAGLGHELNEPLGAILGFAQLAQKHEGTPPAVADDLDRIVRASLHARDIVRQLMMFARRMTVNRSLIDVEETIDGALSLLAGRLRSGRVQLSRSRGAGVPPILADAGQLQQVVINLVLNALLALPDDGGTISVATRADGAHVTIEVTDTGCGMSPEVAERVFEPFFTTRDVGEGTGLGLAVSHGIVTAHGGTLAVRSAPGAGSTFTVHLPIGAAATKDDGDDADPDPDDDEAAA